MKYIQQSICKLFWKIKRYFFIKKYLSENEFICVQFGCGKRILNGWLNSDIIPNKDVVYINIRGKLPFYDNSVDRIYVEHTIEHIPILDGINFLTECHRILKPHGIIRVVTPNIRFLFKLYNKKLISKRYINWSHNNFTRNISLKTPAVIINNFFTDWGHHFIYDKETLSLCFRKAHFKFLHFTKINISTHDELRNLENFKRMPVGFLAFESLVIEAKKD